MSRQSTHAEFLATHPPTFAETGEPLEADNWLRTIESKFGLLCCTKHQKTLCSTTIVRHRRGMVVNFTAAHPVGHQV
jgi:hypothetical protein